MRTAGNQSIILERLAIELSVAARLTRYGVDTADLLRLVSEGRGVRGLLETILGDGDALGNVASRSYRHSNGFDKIVLLSCKKPDFKLRLHVWWPGESTREEHVHNHSWPFSSILLTGALHFMTYARARHGQVMDHFEYRPSEGIKPGYALNRRGRARVACTFSGILVPGVAYTMSHDLLHRVSSDRELLTVTLMVQGARVRDGSDVYVQPGQLLVEEVQGVAFAAGGLRGKLVRILEGVS